MPNFISEDDIEQGMLQRLEHFHGYDSLNCYTTDPENLNDGSGRTDKRDVILHDRLKEAVTALNPTIPEVAIDDALKQLCDKRQVMSAIGASYGKEVFEEKRDKVFELTLDLAINHRKWAA